jgi:hypothetical protein
VAHAWTYGTGFGPVCVHVLKSKTLVITDAFAESFLLDLSLKTYLEMRQLLMFRITSPKSPRHADGARLCDVSRRLSRPGFDDPVGTIGGNVDRVEYDLDTLTF